MAEPNGTRIRIWSDPMPGIIIALVTAVAVVVLTEWVVRVRERRRIIENATLELCEVLPHVVVAISDGWSGEPPDSPGSEWGKQRERLLFALTRIRAYTKWPIWRAGKIRAEADRLLAIMTVAELNRHRTILSRDEMWSIMDHRMFSLVFGKRPLLDKAVKHYEQCGLDSAPPSKS
jgi:hypothetical protein